MSWAGKTKQVHRVVYEHYVGPIPEGMTLDHECRVKHCCRPSHLRPMTSVRNALLPNTNHVANRKHCPRGHPYEGDNLLVTKNKRRVCLTCKRDYDREYMRQKRAGIKKPKVVLERGSPVAVGEER